MRRPRASGRNQGFYEVRRLNPRAKVSQIVRKAFETTMYVTRVADRRLALGGESGEDQGGAGAQVIFD